MKTKVKKTEGMNKSMESCKDIESLGKAVADEVAERHLENMDDFEIWDMILDAARPDLKLTCDQWEHLPEELKKIVPRTILHEIGRSNKDEQKKYRKAFLKIYREHMDKKKERFAYVGFALHLAIETNKAMLKDLERIKEIVKTHPEEIDMYDFETVMDAMDLVEDNYLDMDLIPDFINDQKDKEWNDLLTYALRNNRKTDDGLQDVCDESE